MRTIGLRCILALSALCGSFAAAPVRAVTAHASEQGARIDCFASDPGAGTLDEAAHAGWASGKDVQTIKGNLAHKIGLVTNCGSMSEGAVADFFSLVSLAVARIVPSADCFRFDPGAISTDQEAHRRWALAHSRDQVRENLQWKVGTALGCMPPSDVPKAFAGISAVIASAPREHRARELIGCYKDTSVFDLDGFLERSESNTPQRCIEICRAKQFRYAAVQYGESCLCGNRYGRYGEAQNCDYRCPGDASQICGGYSANSVYATGIETATGRRANPPPRVEGERPGSKVFPEEGDRAAVARIDPNVTAKLAAEMQAQYSRLPPAPSLRTGGSSGQAMPLAPPAPPLGPRP